MSQQSSPYPTPYGNLSQSELESLFSSESWANMTAENRLDACQEVENRLAAEYNVAPCYVTAVPMDGATYGWESNGVISMNASMLSDGTFTIALQDEQGNPLLDENGQPINQSISVLAPNWNSLDTIYHEGTHGIQEAQDRLASTYISPDMDGNLYRIQSCEKEAFANGQSRTLDAIANYQNSTGNIDPETANYIASVKADSFQEALDAAAQQYNDPNIEQTLASVIADHDNGVVPANPSPSYTAISEAYDNYMIEQYGWSKENALGIAQPSEATAEAAAATTTTTSSTATTSSSEGASASSTSSAETSGAALAASAVGADASTNDASNEDETSLAADATEEETSLSTEEENDLTDDLTDESHSDLSHEDETGVTNDAPVGAADGSASVGVDNGGASVDADNGGGSVDADNGGNSVSTGDGGATVDSGNDGVSTGDDGSASMGGDDGASVDGGDDGPSVGGDDDGGLDLD
jgi:hypothetical protein